MGPSGCDSQRYSIFTVAGASISTGLSCMGLPNATAERTHSGARCARSKAKTPPRLQPTSDTVRPLR